MVLTLTVVLVCRREKLRNVKELNSSRVTPREVMLTINTLAHHSALSMILS